MKQSCEVNKGRLSAVGIATINMYVVVVRSYSITTGKVTC